MAKEKPGVMIYFETAKAVKGLDYETKGRLFEAIMEYAEFGVVPEFDGVLSVVWPFVVDKIDRDNARYEHKRERNRINGLISNFKRIYAPKHGIDPEDEVALAEYIEQNTPVANDGERPLTVANDGERIQPTIAESVAGIETRPIAEAPSPIIRDKGTREMDKGLTSQPDNESSHESSCGSDVEYVDFEQRRKDFIEKLRQPT